MKKHILKFLFFVITLALLLNWLVVKDNAYLSGKQRYTKQIQGLEKSSAQYLLVGDSHAGMIEQDALTENFYNLGTASDSMNEIYHKVSYAIRHNPNFKFLLITADYHIMSKYRDSFNNKAYIKPFSTPAEYRKIYNEAYGSNTVSDFLSQFPLFDFNVYVSGRMKLISQIKNRLKGEKFVTSKHKQWLEHPPRERDKRAKERTKIHLTRILAKNHLKSYQNIIQLCNENNITVIGLRYPLSLEYRHHMQPYDLAKMDDIYRDLGFAKFLDYSGLLNEGKYFQDMDHMNHEGVQIFLKKLYADLKQ